MLSFLYPVLLLCLLRALPCAAQSAEVKEHPGLRPVLATNGRWGFIDRTGRFRIKPQFDGAGEFSDGVAYAWRWEGMKRNNGVVDPNGKFTTLPTNDDEIAFHDGLARVQSPSGGERKYGYIDKSGRVVIEPQFDYAGDFSEGLAWVSVLKERQWLYGFIDKSGKFVLPPQFTAQPGDFQEGLAKVQGMYSSGFIDHEGRFRVRGEFSEMDGFFSEGLLSAVSTEGTPRGVYLDRDGRVVFEIPLWQQRTQRQRRLYPHGWQMAAPFSEGFAPVLSFNKIGFINKTGQVVIAPQFRGTSGFQEGLAGVKIIGSDGEYVWGYIDRTGKLAIEPQFKEAQPFAGGLAHVLTLDGQQQLIDKSGKVVWQLSK